MTRDLTRRVIATILALNVYAGQFQRHHLSRFARTQAAAQVDEILVHAESDLANQRLLIFPQCASELWNLVFGKYQFLGVRPNAVDRRTDRQRLAVAVGNRAAMGGNGFRSQVPAVSFLCQKLGIEYLQVHSPGN